VVVTPDYSAFDRRPDLNAAGVIDHLNGFDEFTGDLVYMQSTPWTTNGVTYTSALNIVLGPGIGLGVASNSVSTEFGASLTGQLATDDALTLFGADVTIIGDHVPVAVVISTNLGSYAFGNLDIPLATTGRRFFGIALSRPGEYLTGFRFTVQGEGSTVLLDDVAVGHVAAAPNADPDVSVGGPYAGLEGSAVALTMGGTDGDADPLTYSWDLGDGMTGSGATPPASHTYADNGSYAIMLAVADGRGGVDTARTVATITNVAPVLASFSLPSAAVPLTATGITVPVSSTFTDAGSLDTHTATLDCGTEGLSAAFVAGASPNETISGACSFASAGVHSVRLTVRDDDGASDTELAAGYVVVYDPTGGWVTGGGSIASPVGAFSGAVTAGGKLTFALVVRYQAGATTPSGNADFKLNAAKLDFRSTTFEWMAIADNTVRMQGVGTLNGVADYAFAVVARDGGAGDSIRIRIWHRVTGAVVYDNQPGEPMESDPASAVAGGSLQVRGR
jgi:PKD repeat protein